MPPLGQRFSFSFCKNTSEPRIHCWIKMAGCKTASTMRFFRALLGRTVKQHDKYISPCHLSGQTAHVPSDQERSTPAAIWMGERFCRCSHPPEPQVHRSKTIWPICYQTTPSISFQLDAYVVSKQRCACAWVCLSVRVTAGKSPRHEWYFLQVVGFQILFIFLI